MRYLTVDGMLSGTGVRDSVEGGYVALSELSISADLAGRISSWLRLYENAHYEQYADRKCVASLDAEGVEICKELRKELGETKIDYFSAAEMRKIPC